MPHDGLVMSGNKNIDGKPHMVVFSEDEIKTWIADKIGLNKGQRNALGGKIGSVISDFLNGRGKATSGPAKHKAEGETEAWNKSHTSTYRGREIYHASAGSGRGGSSITIFYVQGNGNDGKIIGIGEHKTSTSYTILWHAKDWHVGNVVKLA